MLSHTHTHTVRVACSMSPYCHLAFLRQHFSPDTFVRTQHWVFPPVFFFKKITSRNIFTTRPSSELNTTKQYEKLRELTSSVWPVLEGWGKQSESVKKVFGNLIEFFLGGDLNQSLHTPTRPLNSTSRPSAALFTASFHFLVPSSNASFHEVFAQNLCTDFWILLARTSGNWFV